MSQENTALEAVFPDKEYWDIEEPKTFDFIANEGKAREVIEDYLEGMKNYKGKPFYITDDLTTRNNVHIASLAEIYSSAIGFTNEFLRVYSIGVASQREGKAVKIAIWS